MMFRINWNQESVLGSWPRSYVFSGLSGVSLWMNESMWSHVFASNEYSNFEWGCAYFNSVYYSGIKFGTI